MWLLLPFVVLPIIEIALFIQVGGLIGLWPTLALVLLSAVAGVAIMRSQGARAGMQIQRSLAEMRDPSRPLAHGAMIILSGALLLTPGFFTDTLGLLLLIPAVRDWVMRRAARHVTVTRTGFGFDSARQPRHGWPGRGDDDVIDGDYVVQEDPYIARKDIAPPDTPPKGGRGPKPSGWTRPD